jgi:hypothetical protein
LSGAAAITLTITVVPDGDPPTPDPAVFAAPPAAIGTDSITMTATVGSDASGPVEYFFDEVSGNPGGTASGWQSSPNYTDTGLAPGTQYTYTVQMRDALQNAGVSSSAASATTDPAPSARRVDIIGTWTIGTTHTAPGGVNRALIVTVHAEDNDSDMNASVTYGGRAMIKVAEQNSGTGFRAYAAIFVLDEAGISAAGGSTFTVNWAQPPSGAARYASVFLAGVNQAAPIGASDGNGSTSGATIATGGLATHDGDLVILAATCGNTGSYSVSGGFTEAVELSIPSADGVVGYKAASGAAETPSVSHSNANRQVILGVVMQAGN